MHDLVAGRVPAAARLTHQPHLLLLLPHVVVPLRRLLVLDSHGLDVIVADFDFALAFVDFFAADLALDLLRVQDLLEELQVVEVDPATDGGAVDEPVLERFLVFAAEVVAQ